MGIELFNQDDHTCILFVDLVADTEEAVQANQVLIVDHGRGMLLDPGGTMTFNELFVGMSRFFPPKELQYVFASHADPDIVASLPRWITGSSTQLLVSRLWARFVPHFCPAGRTEGRVIPIPDRGGSVWLGASKLALLPAHFLHGEGNFQVYDPISKILFSGDLGSSMLSSDQIKRGITNLEAHLEATLPFHRRYMASGRVCAYWAEMVKNLDIEMIVPQHGAPIRGRRAVARFIEWVAELRCGVDLMTQDNYAVPDVQWRIGEPPAQRANIRAA